MTHIKSNEGRKRFICTMVERSNPREIYKIYRCVEKIKGYKMKYRKKYKRKYPKKYKRY